MILSLKKNKVTEKRSFLNRNEYVKRSLHVASTKGMRNFIFCLVLVLHFGHFCYLAYFFFLFFIPFIRITWVTTSLFLLCTSTCYQLTAVTEQNGERTKTTREKYVMCLNVEYYAFALFRFWCKCIASAYKIKVHEKWSKWTHQMHNLTFSLESR